MEIECDRRVRFWRRHEHADDLRADIVGPRLAGDVDAYHRRRRAAVLRRVVFRVLGPRIEYGPLVQR